MLWLSLISAEAYELYYYYCELLKIRSWIAIICMKVLNALKTIEMLCYSVYTCFNFSALHTVRLNELTSTLDLALRKQFSKAMWSLRTGNKHLDLEGSLVDRSSESPRGEVRAVVPCGYSKSVFDSTVPQNWRPFSWGLLWDFLWPWPSLPCSMC